MKAKRGLKEEIASLERRKDSLEKDLSKLEKNKLEKTYQETRYRIVEIYKSRGYKECPIVLTKKSPMVSSMVSFHYVEKGKEGVVLDITPDAGSIILLTGTMHVPDVTNADYVELRLGDSDGEINDKCVISAFLDDFSGRIPAFSATYGKFAERNFYQPKNTVEMVSPSRLEFVTTPEDHNIKSEFCDCAIQCSIFLQT